MIRRRVKKEKEERKNEERKRGEGGLLGDRQAFVVASPHRPLPFSKYLALTLLCYDNEERKVKERREKKRREKEGGGGLLGDRQAFVVASPHRPLPFSKYLALTLLCYDNEERKVKERREKKRREKEGGGGLLGDRQAFVVASPHRPLPFSKYLALTLLCYDNEERKVKERREKKRREKEGGGGGGGGGFRSREPSSSPPFLKVSRFNSSLL